MIKAEPMTEKSWILYKKFEKCGLMRKVNETGYAVMGGPYAGTYTNLKALKETLGDKLTFEKMKTSKVAEKSVLDGFPVKHDTCHEIEHEGLPYLYTKIEGSKDIYAAGYFSVKGNSVWQTVFCPRNKVLKNDENRGPFKSKMDADHETKMENKK